MIVCFCLWERGLPLFIFHVIFIHSPFFPAWLFDLLVELTLSFFIIIIWYCLVGVLVVLFDHISPSITWINSCSLSSSSSSYHHHFFLLTPPFSEKKWHGFIFFGHICPLCIYPKTKNLLFFVVVAESFIFFIIESYIIIIIIIIIGLTNKRKKNFRRWYLMIKIIDKRM